MSRSSVTSKGELALALKEAGFIMLPRLYVKPSDMPGIHRIAFRHAQEVNEIRAQVKASLQEQEKQESAWAAVERLRNLS